MANEQFPMSSPLTYTQLFSTTESLILQIARATARLALTMNQAMDPPQLELWAQELSCFHPTDLAWAFNQTAKTVTAWPTPAKVVNLILAKEFSSDLAWLLTNLKIHGIEWKDKAESRKPASYDPNDPRLWIPGDIIPAIEAPSMPAHIRRALENYGKRNAQQDGLSKLAAHPSLKPNLYDKESEMQRAEDRIENGFRVAWLERRFG